ncbi:MAG: PINc/VapC family ATPase [Candidatus Aenigmatarchaeota archaeon]
MKKNSKQKIVPDTSIVVSGIVSDLIKSGEIKGAEICIPYFVVEELRNQASHGRETGIRGLEEIKQLRGSKEIVLNITGRKQTEEEIRLAKGGRIDALIIEAAKQEGATLYTSDRIQSLAAEAEGVSVKYFEPYQKKEIIISKMLTDDTLSMHMKEDCIPLAKRGKPGSIKLVKIRDKPISGAELESIIKEIMDAARYEENSFIELGGHQASVVQLGDMRIAITRPSFSDSIEITVVRPIVKLTLDDYKMKEELKKRLTENVEGIVIAGPPGSGKSTFAASLANFYENLGNIVKTFESPRDMQVSKSITQYGKLRGSFANTADLLLLVRPDYTVFDEIRKNNDFEVFADMRLAGIGMIGVVHATQPIDAIQRFMSRMELGMIPHVIDTIIYVKDGGIQKVYTLSLTVKMPTGMAEADLARPVVEVRDFITKSLEYEIYTFGEENVIVPVSEKKADSGLRRLAKKQLLRELQYYDREAEVEFVSDNKILAKVCNECIASLIGTGGKNIHALEEKLGMSIEVTPKTATMGTKASFNAKESGASLVFTFNKTLHGETANFYANNEFLFSAIIGKNGELRASKKSELGRHLLSAIMKDILNVYV